MFRSTQPYTWYNFPARKGIFFPLCIGLLLFANLLFLSGCSLSIPYGIYEDKRSFETILDDKALLAAVKGRLIDYAPEHTFSISVYCYESHVFLIGHVDAAFREEAMRIAKETDQVRRVTGHWYVSPVDSSMEDFEVRIDVNISLLTALDISSTQIETNVHNGHVVLLGVVDDKEKNKRIIDLLEDLVGVAKVTSYLIY